MNHRDDIDGLRAVAVLAVVLYHFGFTHRLDGGFVGVDVFFVISGYLITGIVQSDIANERFSLAGFYNRRVRRIFPALFAHYVFCVGAAVAVLFPREAAEVGREVLSSLCFVSNVFFYRSSGYFEQRARLAPLLHTWSLSVEEQFYIVLPLLLYALRKLTRGTRALALGAGAVLSLAASAWMVRVEPARAFYLVQYRAWELLLGSLLALGIVPHIKGKPAEALGAFGLALIGISVARLKESSPFPGLAAVPVCLGTVAVIHSGADVRTATARLLGWRPMRFIGLVSYSFYLWHWPVLKFYLLNRAFVGRPERFALLLVTFCIAALSWRFVEQPFRTKPYRFGPRRTLAAAALAVAGFAAFAFGAPRAASKLRPLPPRVNSVLAYARYNPEISMRDGTCFLSSQSNGAHLFRKDICLAERSDKKNYLLLGDSHAAHFWPGLGALGTDINFLQATASGCSAVRHSTGEKRCTELLTFVFDDFLPAHHLDMILLSGRWVKADLPALEDTVRYMRPFADRVVVLGPIVEYDQSLPRLLANSIYRGEADLPRAHRLAEPLATDRLLAERLKSSPAEYQSVYEVICPRGECAVWAADDVPLQFDYGHLTAEGARLVLERLKPLLFESGRTGRAPNPNHAVRVGG